jgi:hypothetical protein
MKPHEQDESHSQNTTKLFCCARHIHNEYTPWSCQLLNPSCVPTHSYLPTHSCSRAHRADVASQAASTEVAQGPVQQGHSDRGDAPEQATEVLAPGGALRVGRCAWCMATSLVAPTEH